MQTRKFPTFEEAKAYLEERGRLEFFGTIGWNPQYFVYNLYLHDGRTFHINVYEDGLVEIRR